MRKQLPQLSKMSNEAKDDLIRELWEEIQNLRAKLKELEEGVLVPLGVRDVFFVQ